MSTLSKMAMKISLPFMLVIHVQIDEFLTLQVLFPSGAKVAIFRNYWGIDVNLYTPRAKNIANEMGLCLYDWGQDENTYGNNLRYKNVVKKRRNS